MSDYNPFTLVGKTILVTGASSGIGRAISIECSKMGATVILTGRNEERINESLSMLEGSGHRYFICDFDDSNAIVKLAGEVDIIDGLVNNAGFTITKPIPFINDQDLSKLLQVNTIAPILLLKELIKKKKLSVKVPLSLLVLLLEFYEVVLVILCMLVLKEQLVHL